MKIEQWLNTELGIEIWKKKYQHSNETLDQWFDRISGGDKELRRLLVEKKFLFGGRTLSNRGLNNGSYSNCYSSGFVQDDLKDIMNVNTKLALTYKAQGGQGVSLSKIRPKGALIAGRYESDGIVPIMEMYNKTTESIMQGGSRKGALMISIDIKHKEAETFISIKSDITKINKANLSVEIDDEFMEIVEKSYKTQTEIPLHVSRWYGSQKIEYTIIPIILYKKLIKQAHLSAEPGVLFVDRFRNYNLMQYCDYYKIETCNPCLHPDSVIETSEGKVKIKDMTKPMMVYSMDENGKLILRRSTPSWISKKSSNTLNIYINNGEYLTCTPDHKIFIEGKGWIEAQDVKIGDSPIALLRRRRGVKYSGVRLSSQPAGSDIMEHRFIYEGTYGEIPDGFDIHHIDEDTYNNVIDNLECLSHSEHSTLTRYSCSNDHQIKDEDTGRFISSEKKKKTIIPLPENICTNFKSKPRVINISQGDITDVYDINVEETHCFIADGIIVHNCGEQPLPKDGACNLGSINISEYVLKPFTEFASFDVLSFVEDVGTAVRALDDIIDENFPNHAIKEQREMSQKYRNIGLGMMGVADALIKLGYTYGDEGSINFISGLSKLMFRTAALSSAEIAKEKGTFPAYTSSVLSADILKNAEFSSNEWEFITYHGLRNCSLLSIAPTGTLGTMLNISTGIEPNFALSFIRKTEALSGEKLTFQVNCGVAQEYFDATQAESLPDYFVTSHTLNWKDRINFQSAAQEFIDTAISSTINLPKDISVDEVEELYLYAWKKNLKGVTIYRDGCRDGILTLTEETKPSDDFFIRPEVLPAKVMHFKNNNEQWVAFIGEKDGRPFEIFTGPADMELFPIPKFVQSGEIIKVKVPGKETRYDFRYIDSYGYQNTLGGLSRCFDKEYWNYARLVSGMLRQQVKIASIVEIVDGMHTNSESLHSWKNGIIRALKSFIPDGTESTKSCHVCGGKIVYVNGCTQCESCGESKCS